MPLADFHSFSEKLKQQDSRILCSDTFGCHFNDKCSNIDLDIPLQLIIYCGEEHKNQYDVAIKFSQLLVPGDKLV